ncbi:MAG: 50S ribosomal protein L32 [Fastidiosipilaceae bacterium]|jgi:large subunit ribosomal protein L32|nr:50S ribosomal protein L32 [Clostridiaceae bacterium]
MAVPKRKWSKMRSRRSRSNWKVAVPNLVECPRCHSKMMPHRVCKNCGSYKGRDVLNVEAAQ